jgi:large subunit ribosomal protein L17
MRHRVQKSQMNRDKDHRKSLLRNMCTSFIENGKMETTLAKAKYVKPFIEKTVTKAKKGTHFTNIKNIRAIVTTVKAEKMLFSDIAPKYASRNGGYTRIIKLGFRDGDNAEMARLEWVEESKPEKTQKAKPEKTAKKTVKVQKEKKEAPKKPEAKVDESVDSTVQDQRVTEEPKENE